MPVNKNKPSFGATRDKLVKALVKELDSNEPGTSDRAPNVYENYVGFTDKFSVRVVWASWDGVEARDRAEIILDAYRNSKRSGDFEKITSAIGLTPTENYFADMTSNLLGVSPEALRKLPNFAPKKY